MKATTMDMSGNPNRGGRNTGLRDVGNILSLREAIDPQLRVTKYIRSYLATVDIVPVEYLLKLNVLNKKGGGWAVEYDYETGIEKYKKLQRNYKLPEYSGLRLWLTDDTQAFEEISQHFDNNIIEEGLNSLTGKARSFTTIFQSTKSTAVGNTVATEGEAFYKKTTKQMAKGIGNFVGGMLGIGSQSGTDVEHQQAINNMLSGLADTAGDIIFEGKQISLPRIWKGSNYNPTLNLVIKLVSPYGHKTAIKNYILKPLLYILLLSSPRSSDGLSYGQFQPVRVKAYGLSNINLGAIMNVSIRRGGKETAYNVWKQPLIVEVALSIRPLADGFAAMDETPDVATFEDGDVDYNDHQMGSPIITTVGNIIQSLRPAPKAVVDINAPSPSSAPITQPPIQMSTLPTIDPNSYPLTSDW